MRLTFRRVWRDGDHADGITGTAAFCDFRGHTTLSYLPQLSDEKSVNPAGITP